MPSLVNITISISEKKWQKVENDINQKKKVNIHVTLHSTWITEISVIIHPAMLQ